MHDRLYLPAEVLEAVGHPENEPPENDPPENEPPERKGRGHPAMEVAP